jgi:hypothetical protein
MSSLIIGKVKSPSGKNYEVKWNPNSKEVYISYAGWKYIGHASSSSEAMIKAEAWLFDK